MTEKNIFETYFEWWLDELKSVGLVKNYWREPQSFVLFDSKPIFFNQYYKSKDPIVKSFNLFQPTTCTPDYKVIFDTRLINELIGIVNLNEENLLDFNYSLPGNVFQKNLFYSSYVESNIDNGTMEVWFDVKPTPIAVQFSSSLGSSRDFKYNARLLYEKHEVILNKVVPIGNSNSLFAKTFIPRRYLWSDKGKAIRKLKEYEKKSNTLDQYLKLKNIEI